MADEDDHLDDNAIDAADERIADSQTVRWWALARLLVASRPLPAFSSYAWEQRRSFRGSAAPFTRQTKSAVLDRGTTYVYASH